MPEPESEASEEPRHSGRVLLAEDDPTLLRATARALESLGVEVIRARDGSEALKLLDDLEDELTLVFSDLVMPGASGIEIYRHTRTWDRRPFFLLTTGNSDQARLSPEVTSAVPLLRKPWTVKELHEAIDATLTEGGWR